MNSSTSLKTEQIAIIPGFEISKPDVNVVALKPRMRFEKIGDNANHQHTTYIRSIKTKLQLTTRQFVAELNAYEREHQSKNFQKRLDIGTPSWLPMTAILMSSYLQGWVVQEQYMAQMVKRVTNLYNHKVKIGLKPLKGDIRQIMDGWYKSLNISLNTPSVSPTRLLGKMIAPFYKRPVLAAVAGRVKLANTNKDAGSFKIVDDEGIAHSFILNEKEEVLIKNGQLIKVGDLVQYSVLMQVEKVDGKTVTTPEPSINHTTFFRWYSSNKMPRSIKTVELVQAAVDQAVKAMRESEKTA
jgi:hypothetical protein